MLRITKKQVLMGLGAISFSFITLVIILTGIALETYAQHRTDINQKERLINGGKRGLVLLDRTGTPFYTFYPGKVADYVPLQKIPIHFQDALIATEDKTFYKNSGFSLKGIIRAAWANLTTGQIVQGGSTITQGLVKNLLLSPDRTYLRKFREIILAGAVTQRYSKAQILEMYTNSVYFGEGAVGLEEAALTYFGISAADLTLAQASMLVGLLPAPSDFSPYSHPEAAKKRQAIVLSQMVEEGMISQATADKVLAENLTFTKQRDDLNTFAHHFALYVRDQLFKRYGEQEVIRSGMVVTTTLQADWQRYAESVVAAEVGRLNRNGATNGAAVVIDPHSGQIIAMVGSVDWYSQQFGKVNMAITPRQSGSAFKPIVYALALEKDFITPATVLEDRPKTFAGNYKPQNYDRSFRGYVTVRRALANSLNVPAVQVMQQVGVPAVLKFAQSLGIKSLGKPSDYGLSLVLGTGEVSLLELTNAYATFANQGIRHTPTSVLAIVDKYNQPINIDPPDSHRVVSEGVAYLISSILSDSRARREEFGSVLDINRSAAVKTGTSQEYRNALTVGYTPELAIGVWVGNNDNRPMSRIAGSLGAAPIWKQLMTHYLGNRPNLAFNQPSSVAEALVCSDLGVHPYATGSARKEYFISGTQSSYACSQPKIASEVVAKEIPPTPEPSPTIIVH